MYKKYFKRVFDIFSSLAAILVLSPLLISIAVLVRIKLGSPVIFKQDRPGLGEKIFTLYKFRTMTDERYENGKLKPDETRLTRFGSILRSTSMDELPELINVLKGDMSVIGPRPLAVKYLPFYNEREKLRHTVRPGLSGLAQVNGRNAINWEDKFEYDISYIEQVSFVLDCKIVFKTILKVFQRSDIGVAGVNRPMNFNEYRQKQYDSVKNSMDVYPL